MNQLWQFIKMNKSAKQWYEQHEALKKDIYQPSLTLNEPLYNNELGYKLYSPKWIWSVLHLIYTYLKITFVCKFWERWRKRRLHFLLSCPSISTLLHLIKMHEFMTKSAFQGSTINLWQTNRFVLPHVVWV